MTNLGLDPDRSGEGANKSGGVQISVDEMFTRHIWSRTEHIQKTSLESGEETGQVLWIGLALE
jgi:hypothetical protein